jgi:hypothetical protein
MIVDLKAIHASPLALINIAIDLIEKTSPTNVKEIVDKEDILKDLERARQRIALSINDKLRDKRGE